jgi:hypothetical protein
MPQGTRWPLVGWQQRICICLTNPLHTPPSTAAATAAAAAIRCERIRSDSGEPVKKCYRALGGRWWGGSDQWYAWNNGKFTPCGGPNPDYKNCLQYPACAEAKPWPWADEKGTSNGTRRLL